MKILAAALLAFSLSGCSLVPVDWRREQTTCPVHGTTLKEETRRISYRLYPYTPGLAEAERDLFPCANTTLRAGCVVADWPRRARIRYCIHCRLAEREWWAER